MVDPIEVDVADVHLAVRGLGKSFGATRALDDVSLDVRAGSVHAFVGENGAGKSTLGKIIAGVYPPDQGELILRGEPVAFRSPRAALDRGIALVAQEVALVPHMTVVENIVLGNEPRRAGFVDRGRSLNTFRRLIDDSGFDLRPGDRVGGLPLAKQQQVEILRALAREAALVVLDEPSAAMSAVEVERLHGIVRSLTRMGRTVILVSHFLPEVLELADTITVLRDGKVVSSGPAAGETEASLIAKMLGRALGRIYPEQRPPGADAESILDVQGLVAPGVHDASLQVRAGEIVALAGLIGAGRSELVRAIYGAAPSTAGSVTLRGGPLPRSPRGSLGAGVSLIPESRKDDGLMLHRPVRENVSLTALPGMSRLTLVRPGRERRRVREALERVAGTTRLEEPALALSGGNQQKLLFARALLTEPGLLIADEPTRGVDVGAKRDLYALLVELAAGGMGVLLVSNEMEEILGLAHRVVVMRAGSVVADLRGSAVTEEAILGAMFGTASAA
jgi:simple sugar transport system ATP-binding protein/ribose transport system ATP-binding protein